MKSRAVNWIQSESHLAEMLAGHYVLIRCIYPDWTCWYWKNYQKLVAGPELRCPCSVLFSYVDRGRISFNSEDLGCAEG